MHVTKVAIATAVYLTGLAIATEQATAANLLIGRYGSFVRDINELGYIPQSKTLAAILANEENLLIGLNKQQLEIDKLLADVETLDKTEVIKQQLTAQYSSFTDAISEANPASSEIVEPAIDSPQTSTSKVANADQINQAIEERYQGLVESSEEKIDLFMANKINKELLAQEGETNNVNSEALKNALGIENQITTEDIFAISESYRAALFIAIVGAGCIVSFPIINAFGSEDSHGVLALLGDKYGKPKVPDSAVDLHKKTFRKLMNLGNKITRIDNEKFGREEFTIYLKLRDKVEAGTAEYKKLCQSIKYLEVAIAAQSSYIKLESTELRYRSRKQQEFYNFVTENISDDIDKDKFRILVKKKLAEIVPLVSSEEGRNALKSYLQEINKISQHDLGLKLLALFKKYQLADFTILRKVSDIVERVNAQDVISEKSLTVIVLENYDTLKKLAPTIQIEEEDISPETFTKILQYMGLVRRHEKSYTQFKDLLKTLNKWQEACESLTLVRKQYSNGEYRLPEEFRAKVPGKKVYRKYEKYLSSS